MRKCFRVISGAFAVLLLAMNIASCSPSGSKERMADQSNTLYVGYVGSSFPSSFMPWQSREGIAPTLSSMIYSTLFSYDDETDNYNPLLAVDWCYIDPEGNPIRDENGKTDYERLEALYGESATYLPVKVTLNDQATWSDGERVTAEDIFFTFDLCADNSRSGHAGALAWVSDLQHAYSGGNKTMNGIYTYNHNQGNKYTFAENEKDTVIYLHVNKVLGSIATLFSTILILPEHVWAPVISKEMPANSTTPNSELTYLYQHPVGCGAYTLDVENSNAQVIFLDRRDDYYMMDEEDPTQPYYKVDRIKFILYQEENVAIFALLKGYIDVLDSTINPNYRSLFLKEENMQVIETSNEFVTTLVINMNPTKDNLTDLRALLTNQDFRRAIALAINQEELIKNVKDNAATTYSAGLISTQFPEMYNEASNILSAPIEDRVAEANRILDQYCPEKDDKGYRLYKGKRVAYEITANVSDQDLVSFLQIQFQKIGIEVTYKAAGSSPENTYYYAGKFDMTFQSVTFSSSNIDIMMKSHFVTLNKSSNYGRLVNSDLSSKIEEMRTTLNRNRKNELIQELQVLVAEQYYKIPLYSSNIISVARTDRYTGWVDKPGNSAFSTDSLKALERVS